MLVSNLGQDPHYKTARRTSQPCVRPLCYRTFFSIKFNMSFEHTHPSMKSFLRLKNTNVYFMCVYHLCRMFTGSRFSHFLSFYCHNILGDERTFRSTLLCTCFPFSSTSLSQVQTRSPAIFLKYQMSFIQSDKICFSYIYRLQKMLTG
jgi:Na+/melibiose symporter-like transporter